MKRIVLAVILGLVVGWILSHTVFPRSEVPASVPGSTGAKGISALLTRQGPAAPRARSATSLDDQRAEAGEGRTFSPIRARLFSMDLVQSLSGDQLIEAFRAGQVRDGLEVAAAFGKIAETDPRRALQLVREIAGRRLKDRAQSAVIRAWAKSAPKDLLDFLQEQPVTSERGHIAREFAGKWVESDPEAAFAHLDELVGLGGIFSRDLAESLVKQWAETDFEAAERWVEQSAEPAKREALRDALLFGHVATLQGGEAVDFVLERPDNAALQKQLTKAMEKWAFGDPEAAIQRWASLPEEHVIWEETTSLGRSAMLAVLMRRQSGGSDGGGILEWSHHLPPGEPRRQYLLGAANLASSNDLPMAEKIIAQIPESRERVKAVGMFAELWMRKDPVALSEWLGALEPSPSRDAAVSRFVRLLVSSDPDRAREWAETLSDPAGKARLLKELP